MKRGYEDRHELRLIQISDSHFPSREGTLLRGVDADAGLESVLRHPRLGEGDADIIIHTGDLVQTEAKDEPQRRARLASESYVRVTKALAALDRTVYCLPGNHDDLAIMEKAVEGSILSCRRWIRRGAWQILMLDTTVPGSPGGHLRKEELQWLDEILSGCEQHAVVAMHHPPVSIDSAWLDTMTIDNAEELFAVLQRHSHVRAVVFGHIHQEHESHRGELALLGSPSTSLQFVPGAAEPKIDAIAPGFRSLELRADGTVLSRIHRTSLVQPGRRAG